MAGVSRDISHFSCIFLYFFFICLWLGEIKEYTQEDIDILTIYVNIKSLLLNNRKTNKNQPTMVVTKPVKATPTGGAAGPVINLAAEKLITKLSNELQVIEAQWDEVCRANPFMAKLPYAEITSRKEQVRAIEHASGLSFFQVGEEIHHTKMSLKSLCFEDKQKPGFWDKELLLLSYLSGLAAYQKQSLVN